MKRMLSSLLFACSTFVLSSSAMALSFKCDKAQTRCEVDTRRLTEGDKVAVFTEEKKLIGLGEVTGLEGSRRIVKITKKWGTFLRSHEMEIIQDEEYQNPTKTFVIVTPLGSMAWGAQLGLVNLGVGDGFIGFEVSGLFFKHFWRDFSYFGRVHYLSGSGKASDNLGGATAQDVSVSSMGLSGGISELLLPYSPVSIRLDAELGFSYGSVDLAGGFEEDKVLNSRFKDGAGVYLRGGPSMIWRRGGIQPELGIAFLHIHNSNSAALTLGVNSSI
ncbi:MAG: hypothetical protein EOP10_13675 [Proteobacteria bacterium]|nr:MAG: hypothetical protein EOP10_13675 [Pseudomonadota bacterium]